MDQEIGFEYEGKKYAVSRDAYTLDLAIRLPDDRMIRAQYWQESEPPIPQGLAPCAMDQHVFARLVEDENQS